MSGEVKTLRVKSTHPASQGPYVVIDAAKYDPAVHTLYEPDVPAPAATPAPAAKPAARRKAG